VLAGDSVIAQGELTFLRALGRQVGAFRDVVTSYALQLKGQGAVTSPDFVVTPTMRDSLRTRLAARGVTVDATTFKRRALARRSPARLRGHALRLRRGRRVPAARERRRGARRGGTPRGGREHAARPVRARRRATQGAARRTAVSSLAAPPASPLDAPGARYAAALAAPRVFVVGPGRAGLGLARAVLAAGGTVTGRARATRPRRRRADRPGDGRLAPAAALAEATVVFVAVQDRELEAALAALIDAPLPREAVVLQASGSAMPAAFDALRQRGIACGTFHPLVPLAAPEHAPALLRGAWVGLAGDDRALGPARALATLVRAHVLRIPAGGQALYHAAAVFASNFPVVLAALAERLLREAGVAREEARPAVRHLLSSAAANLQRGDDAALTLTGPVVRGDVGTVQRHLEALAGAPALGDVRAVYAALAHATLDVARAADVDEAALHAIAALLAAAAEPSSPS
jgi:predicted short-subunit dehydrogenase-like oxidoreductase (DUF2520 family)